MFTENYKNTVPGFNAAVSLIGIDGMEDNYSNNFVDLTYFNAIEPARMGPCCDTCNSEGSVCNSWHRCLTEEWSDSQDCYNEYGLDCINCERTCMPCPV